MREFSLEVSQGSFWYSSINFRQKTKYLKRYWCIFLPDARSWASHLAQICICNLANLSEQTGQNQCAISTAVSSERECFSKEGCVSISASDSCKMIALLNLENRNPYSTILLWFICSNEIVSSNIFTHIKHQFNMNSWLWLSLFWRSELFSCCRKLFPMHVAGSGTTVLTEGNCVPRVTWQLPVTHSYCHLN